MENLKICKHCYFFVSRIDDNNESKNYGECRFKPPDFTIPTSWVLVENTDYCGQFKEDDNLIETGDDKPKYPEGITTNWEE